MNKRLRVFSVTISIICSLMIIFLSSILISRNINYSKNKQVKVLDYNVTNKIDKTIIVEPNNYYENEINNDNVISSIINNIKLKANYKLDLDKNINTRIKYSINAKLLIQETKDISVKTLLEVDNILLEKEITGNIINEEIDSNYKEYYNKAREYKATYPITGLEAKVIYTFNVEIYGIDNEVYLDDISSSSLSISLLDSVTTITSNNLDNIPRVIYKNIELPFINNPIILILSIIMFIIGVLFLIPLFMAIRLINKQNEYKNTIKNYLKIYDDIIVETISPINTNKKQIIEVSSFYELLDAYQELHIPILFYEVENNKEAWFTISNNKKVWRFILKNKNNS